MSTRCRILKELKQFFAEHPGDWAVADSLDSYKKAGERAFIISIRQLLTEGFVLSKPVLPDEFGSRLAVKLNPEKLDAVDRECNLDWRWWIVFVVGFLAMVAAILTIPFHELKTWFIGLSPHSN
jgi:hypothetical protein